MTRTDEVLERDQICDQDAPELVGPPTTNETFASHATVLTWHGTEALSRCGTTQAQLITQRS
jgi:hypothetical protein